MPKRRAKRTESPAAPDGTRVLKTREKEPQFFRGARLMVSEDEARANFDEIPDLRQRLFLEALSEIPRISRAAAKATVSMDQVSRWRKSDDQRFLQAFEVAFRMGVERAESELWRRGFEGVEKPVYQSGRLVGTVREFDTPAAMFMLRGAMPEKYREKPPDPSRTTVGTVNHVTVQLAGLSDEELQKRLEQTRRALQAGSVIDVTPEGEK